MKGIIVVCRPPTHPYRPVRARHWTDAVGRLSVLHKIYSPMGNQVLLDAGISQGMTVADFGCGSGTMSRLLASLVGSSGSVTGIDLHTAQIEEARRLSAMAGLSNVRSSV